MSCVKEFRNNSDLSKQAKTFRQFLDYRSNFDKGYLEKYWNDHANPFSGTWGIQDDTVQ